MPRTLIVLGQDHQLKTNGNKNLSSGFLNVFVYTIFVLMNTNLNSLLKCYKIKQLLTIEALDVMFLIMQSTNDCLSYEVFLIMWSTYNWYSLYAPLGYASHHTEYL